MKSYRISNIPRQLSEEDVLSLLGEYATIDVFAPAANATDSETKMVALVNFQQVPEDILNKTTIKLPKGLLDKIGLKRWYLVIDTDFLGLTPLNIPDESIVMDVVAVTGLGGHAFGSWKAKNGDFMWLQDALSEDVKGLRIMTYGFDSALAKSTSFANISTYAKRLLHHLIGARSHADAKKRPLLFVCHSLGGLVAKECLALAGEDEVVEPAVEVLKSTVGLLLYGVPNRGLSIQSLLPMVVGQPNRGLVEALKPESDHLDKLHQNFCARFKFGDSEIVSFWETKESPTARIQDDGITWKMNGPMEVLVSKSSATGSRPNEPLFNEYPVEAPHSEMVKFKSMMDCDYTMVRDKIKELSERAPEIIFKRFAPSASITEEENLLSIQNGWSELHLACHKGYLEKVKQLLKEGALIEKTANNGATALHTASAAGHGAIVRLLLDRGARIEATNYVGSTSLYYACEGGHEVVVRLLIERGAFMTPVRNGGYTPLHRAAGQGKELVVKILLDHKPDIVDMRSNDGNTPLHSAATSGYYQVVRLLLSRGADKQAINKELQTPLHQACVKGSEETVRELLHAGVNIEAKASDGRNPLYVAAENGFKAVVEVLLSRGADLHGRGPQGWTPLHIASAGGQEAIVRFLLDKGAFVDALAIDGCTPLHSASNPGRTTIAAILLDHGADIMARNKDGMAALHIAATTGREEVARLLLSRGADISQRRFDNSTALHDAVRAGNEQMVIFLLDQGAEIEAKCDTIVQIQTVWGPQVQTRIAAQTPLQLAALLGNISVCKLLLHRQANTEVQIENCTPLHIAAIQGRCDVITVLLDAGANINAKALYRSTPLMQAAIAGREDSVRTLLNRGADIEAKARSTWTSLHFASAAGHSSVVQTLLNRGADIRATDRLWRSPLSLAKSGGHLNVVRLLEEHGAVASTSWWRRSPGPPTSGKTDSGKHPPERKYEERESSIRATVEKTISERTVDTASGYSTHGTCSNINESALQASASGQYLIVPRREKYLGGSHLEIRANRLEFGKRKRDHSGEDEDVEERGRASVDERKGKRVRQEESKEENKDGNSESDTEKEHGDDDEGWGLLRRLTLMFTGW